MNGRRSARPEPAAEPLQAIAAFAAYLRDHGLVLGVAEQQTMIRSALLLPLERSRALRAAWRSIACKRARDWRAWPELFDRFWHPGRARGATRVSGELRASRDLRAVVQALQQQLAGDASSMPPAAPRPDARIGDTALSDAFVPDASRPDLRAQGGASRVDALDDRSGLQWLPQDLGRLNALAQRIADRLRRRRLRRQVAHRLGRRLDVRRTLRASLRYGGEPVAPCWRRPRREQPRLFIVVDVSRSMQTHAQLFLRIARAFVQSADARVFVFHTRLAEVTGLLRRDSETVQEKVNAVTAGFGGGTRIAASLADLMDVHVRGQLGRRSRLWILSDGFDADAPEALAERLRRLHATGTPIVWFHPGRQAPQAAAVRAGAASIRRFVALDSLADLSRVVDLVD